METEKRDRDRQAEETPSSEIPKWHPKRQQNRTLRGRFTGCLVGGAIGDALGAPIEFTKRSQIEQRYGAKGITDFDEAYGGYGTITDDTQMTLFTAEGLIRGWVRQGTKGITTYPGVTAHAYLRWLETQGERPVCDLRIFSDCQGWLIQQRELHQRRAPGNTCITALKEMQHFGASARNDSKGCGGVMRVAPVGLFAWRMGKREYPEHTFELGCELAELTHGHPTGKLTAGVFAVLIQALTDAAPLTEALSTAKAILRKERDYQETLEAIELAEQLAKSNLPPTEAIAKLGEGWIAEEALAISIYCALTATTFRRGVLMAVNHDGDSDSTGAITGNLLGAKLGLKSIPEKWVNTLELKETILEIADDLYEFNDWIIDDRVWDKYPGF